MIPVAIGREDKNIKKCSPEVSLQINSVEIFLQGLMANESIGRIYGIG